MARPVITLSRQLMRQIQFDWRIEWRGVASGTAFNGNSAYVVNALPRWIGTPQFVTARSALAHWRATIAQMQGRHGTMLIDMCEPAAFGMQAGAYKANGLPFANGTYLTTGKGMEFERTVRAHRPAARGATSILVTDDVPGVGQIMSHDDWPFMVTFVTVLEGGVYEIGVQMPLRRAIAQGDTIRMQGRGLFEVTDEAQGWASYGLDRVATPSISLQEVLNR